jgi:hypothetical protein
LYGRKRITLKLPVTLKEYKEKLYFKNIFPVFNISNSIGPRKNFEIPKDSRYMYLR